MPYLSPLVLRKELENMLANNSDAMLQTKDLVTQKAILFWNMVSASISSSRDLAQSVFSHPFSNLNNLLHGFVVINTHFSSCTLI